ncbi:MAG: hypothetical protein AABZ06_11755 [Bdellovibrionota bacterium]
MRKTKHQHDDQEGGQMPSIGWLAGPLTKIIDAGLPWLKHWREKRRIENKIILTPSNIYIYIEAKDNGRIDFWLNIANFSNKNLEMDHIEINWWKIGTRRLPDKSEFIRASGDVKKQSVGRCGFSISLLTADIRDIVRGIEVAQNTKCNPRAELELSGRCVLVSGNKLVKVPMQINKQVENVDISNVVAASIEFI